MELAPIDFLEALTLKETAAEIAIGGRTLSVPRARLGPHYRLQALLGELGEGRPLDEVAALYLTAATGLTEEELDAGTADEVLTAFGLLADLNRFRGTLPAMWPQPGDRGRERPEDYPNRALASLVASLAHAYGWPADHILGLGPEEAACYLQEALVIEHQEREFRWGLAGLVDKSGKPVKFPPIRWGRPPRVGPPKAAQPIPPQFRPAGIVVSPRDIERRGAQ